MADGRILDAVSDNDGRILQVTYTYTLAGVQYESSQDLSSIQQEQSNQYAPGRHIIVRYDPKRPANSIVVYISCPLTFGLRLLAFGLWPLVLTT